MTQSEIITFLNWFIRHYSTATDDEGFMYYANSEGKQVTLGEIIHNFQNR